MFFKSKKRNIDLKELEEDFQNLIKNFSNFDLSYGTIKKEIFLIDKKIKEIKKKENHFIKSISNFVNENKNAGFARRIVVYEEKMRELKNFFEIYFPQLEISITEIIISHECKAYRILSPAFTTLNDIFLILKNSIGEKFYYFENRKTHEFDDFNKMMSYWIDEHFHRFYLKKNIY